MNRIQRLARVVAALRAQRLAETSAPTVAEALTALGYEAKAWAWEGGTGVTVNLRDGAQRLSDGAQRKLDDLEAHGVCALVVVVRSFDVVEGDRDRGGALLPAGPATPVRARVVDPPANRRRNDG